MENVEEVEQFITDQRKDEESGKTRVIILAATYGEGEPTDSSAPLVQAIKNLVEETDGESAPRSRRSRPAGPRSRCETRDSGASAAPDPCVSRDGEESVVAQPETLLVAGEAFVELLALEGISNRQ